MPITTAILSLKKNKIHITVGHIVDEVYENNEHNMFILEKWFLYKGSQYARYASQRYTEALASPQATFVCGSKNWKNIFISQGWENGVLVAGPAD